MASIQKLLPTIVTIQIFVAMGVTGVLSFVSAKKEVEDIINKIIVQGSTLIEDRVMEYLATPHFFQEMNQIAIANGNLNMDDFDNLESFFWRQVQIGVESTSQDALSVDEQGVEFIYYGNQQGEFIGVKRIENDKSSMRLRTQQTAPNMIFYELDSQGKRSEEIGRQRYDPRERPWYQAAQSAGKLTWSSIYSSASDGSLGINSTQPIYDENGALRGVLSIEITLKRISEFLNGLKQLRLTDNSKAFIIDRSGKLVGTSIGEMLYKQTARGNQQIEATESSDRTIQGISQMLLNEYKILETNSQKQPFSVDIDGNLQNIQVTRLDPQMGLDWLIIVVIPESDFMDKIHDNVKMTMLLSLATLAGAVAIGLMTSRWIVRPISLLNTAAHEIQGEQFKPERLVGVMKRQDELGQLARVFQEMAVKIYNREQGMKKQMDRLRLEQDKAKEASKLATMNQKAYLLDLLKQSRTLHTKTAEYEQLHLSELLRKVKYFQNFSDQDIEELIKIGYKKTMPEGEYVCREDEPGDAFYIILTGNVEIYVEKINKFLTNQSDGTFFGELSLLLGIPRTATVRTTTDTLLFVLDRDGLQTLLQNYQELADQIAIELHKHKAELDSRQEMLENLGLIEDNDTSFTENLLSWIRKRIKALFGV